MSAKYHLQTKTLGPRAALVISVTKPALIFSFPKSGDLKSAILPESVLGSLSSGMGFAMSWFQCQRTAPALTNLCHFKYGSKRARRGRMGWINSCATPGVGWMPSSRFFLPQRRGLFQQAVGD